MLSRWLVRFTGISTICLVACAVASAQYGGGGGTGGSGGTGGTGGSGGTGGYVAPSGGYGSGKAIGIGVGAAAGAAVAVVLLVRHHRHHAENNTPIQAYVTGCTQSVQNGIELTSEKDNQTYSVVSNDNSLKTGERVTLKGTIVSGDGSATPSFQVLSMVKDYGACSQASASNSSSLSSHSPSGLTNFPRTSADQLSPR